MKQLLDIAKKFLWLFYSRKGVTGIVTVLSVVLARWGFQADAEILAAIVAVGLSLIFGTAIEDAGAKVGLPPPGNGTRDHE